MPNKMETDYFTKDLGHKPSAEYREKILKESKKEAEDGRENSPETVT